MDHQSTMFTSKYLQPDDFTNANRLDEENYIWRSNIKNILRFNSTHHCEA